jgi:hypothetical protein
MPEIVVGISLTRAVFFAQGPNCVMPLDPYTKLALGVIAPFVFLVELAITCAAAF